MEVLTLVQQGKIYDSPESVKPIPSFIQTYGISTEELEQPDITKYACFNEFFYRCVLPHRPLEMQPLTYRRKLRPGVRPVQDAADASGFCSAADSRLTVYPTTDLARQFWYKPVSYAWEQLLMCLDRVGSKAATSPSPTSLVLQRTPRPHARSRARSTLR